MSGPLIFIVIALLFFSGCDKNQTGLSTTQASGFLSEYFAALETADTTRIKTFWDEASHRRAGFWFLHASVGRRIYVSDWPDFLKTHSYDILRIEDKSDYSIIHLEWHTDGQKKDMRYYATIDSSGMHLVNPLEILTRDWHTIDRGTLSFHYPPSLDIESYMPEISHMDSTWRRLLHIFKYEPKRPIDFYRALNQQQCGELILHPPSNGYALMAPEESDFNPEAYNKALSISFINPHELVHALSNLAGFRFASAALTEGIAVAFGGTTTTGLALADIESRYLFGRGMHIDLARMLKMSDRDFLQKNYHTYHLAGSFVRYLYKQYGIDRLRVFCNSARMREEIPEILEQVYGQSAAELQRLWQSHIMSLPIATMGNSIPAQARTVFSLDDVTGDDTGDGDYTYPGSDRFPAGNFDLTGFEVLADSQNVYFKIRLARLGPVVTYGQNGERFAAGVTIAIDRSPQNDTYRQKQCHGICFKDSQGYDLKINAALAVSVVNRFEKVIYTSVADREFISDSHQNSLVFSLPRQLIGDPKVEWKYFVGSGLYSDRTMNFIYAGPMPVQMDHPVFISGGNYIHGNPDFIDILLPASYNQEKILGEYDAQREQKALVPMIGNNPF